MQYFKLKELNSLISKINKILLKMEYELDQSVILAGTDLKGVIKSVKAKFCEFYQYTREELIEKPHNLLNSNHHPRSFFQEMWHPIAEGKIGRIEGSACPIATESDQVSGVVITFRDVTKVRSLMTQLKYEAERDSLTGLFNRHYFENHVSRVLREIKYKLQVQTLCYLDLNQFKIVNDTCGHMAGDELLRQISDILRKNTRSSDIVARIGGDEFAILLKECDLTQAYKIVSQIRDDLENFQFVYEGKKFRVRASFGLARIDKNIKNMSSLLTAAEAACYAAKEQGENQIYIYQESDKDLMKIKGESQWVVKIVDAIENQKFCLYKQKIERAFSPGGSCQEVKYEILLRMVSETGDLISPLNFIPSAEKYGLMSKIDKLVVKMLFEYLSVRVLKEPLSETQYLVNLSATTIGNEKFLDYLLEQFDHYQINPQIIVFEITETAAIANINKAKRFIDQLKQVGCKFALDDFGTGMSSFAYLKDLAIDYLKIDGSFVKNMLVSNLDSAIVESSIKIAKVLGIKTIAEFVESQAIREKLIEMGVDYVQGYGVSGVNPLGN